jgi:hypothetical protein
MIIYSKNTFLTLLPIILLVISTYLQDFWGTFNGDLWNFTRCPLQGHFKVNFDFLKGTIFLRSEMKLAKNKKKVHFV